MEFEALSTTFAEQITACSEVLVVASPFYNPLVIQRVWCLYEAVLAWQHNVAVTVVSPPREAVALRDRIMEDGGHEILIEVMMRIKSSDAVATVVADQMHIKAVIEANIAGGYLTVDDIYKTAIRQWVLGLLTELAETFHPRTDGLALFLVKCGLIFNGVGDTDKSIEFQTRAFRVYASLYGVESEHVAATFVNIASANHIMGKYDTAVGYLDKALVIQLKVLGPDHLSVAKTYGGLGDAYKAKGEYDRAIEFQKQSLAIQLNLEDSDRLSLATTYSSLGIAHRSKGEHDRAIDFQNKALAIQLEIHGPDHPSTADTYGKLGNVYRSKGEYATAVDFLNKALAIQLKVHGPDHPSTTRTYCQIGDTYMELGENDVATVWLQKAVTVSVATLGDDHPQTRYAKHQLAFVTSH
jgi:tetratricopeptide (TPR) repeat protein